jgi:predicted transcriptional regulator
MKSTPSNDKPTPVRLKELKAPLQQEAMQMDRSLNWLIRSIIKKYLSGKEKS